MRVQQNKRARKGSPANTRHKRDLSGRREAILTAAREVFFERGVHRATMDDIAARAGVAKGTVYLYFESKETLLAHLLLEALEVLARELETAYASGARLAADQRLRQLAAAYPRFFNENPDYFRLMMAFDRGAFQEAVSADVYRKVLSYSVRGLRWVVLTVQQGMDEGLFAPGEAKKTAGMIWAALNGVLVLLSHPLRRELVEQEVETLYEGVLALVPRGLRDGQTQSG